MASEQSPSAVPRSVSPSSSAVSDKDHPSSSKRKRTHDDSRSHRHSSSRKSSSHRRSRSRSPSHRSSSHRKSSPSRHSSSRKRKSRDSSLEDSHRHSSSSRRHRDRSERDHHRDRDREERHRSSRDDSRERKTSRRDDHYRTSKESSSRRHRDEPERHSRRDDYPREKAQDTSSTGLARKEESVPEKPKDSTQDTEQIKPVEGESSLTIQQPSDAVPQSEAPPPAVDEEDEKIRQRKERIEQWKRERALKEVAEKKQEEKPEAPAYTSTSVIAATESKPTASFGLKTSTATSNRPTSFAKPMSFGKSKFGSKSFSKSSISLKIAPVEKPEVLKPSAASSLMYEDDDENEAGDRSKRLKKISFAPLEEVDKDVEASAEDVQHGATGAEDALAASTDIVGDDPLEAFMEDVQGEVDRIREEDIASGKLAQASGTMNLEQVTQVNESWDADEPDEMDESRLLALAASKAAVKKKDLPVVDHSQRQYEPFRKNFYVEPEELASMTEEEVDQKRLDLDGIKIRGVECPKPIEKWTQFGMPPGALEVIRKVLKYERPSPIQAQAIPAIVSGRDVIGIAKTGSGKTIAFLLPMFRHIKDQRPISNGEGPIALIMTPTRELAVQIHKECKHFTKVLNLRAVCCYGGAPIKDQIAELKRGAEIIICTPGRMIDLLCANSGKVTNVGRVTYLVLDEADRMFDLGFEPQVMKMVKNIRPDRQTVLFSATFPRRMEALARKILQKPLEITVGARSVVAPEVTQIVEVHEDEENKYHRLLEILGLLATNDLDAKVLVFVDRQEAADGMLVKLLRRGYPCLSLHGGKDQADRESTISDFKSGTASILIATSVAARGLDVKDLKVVVNYECPNHMEDYVHRCGRTGRGGKTGTAYTFLTPDQDKFAPDIIKALTMSGVEIPPPLQELVDGFLEKIKHGTARFSSSGFGGKGLEMLEEKRDEMKKIQKKSMGGEFADDEDDDDVHGTPAAKEVAEPTRNLSSTALEVINRLRQAAVSQSGGSQGIQVTSSGRGRSEPAYSFEFVINDFPSQARYRITRREQISELAETTGCAITTRGVYVPEGRQPPPGERKLYLVIEGDSEMDIRNAKAEIQRIIVDATVASMESEGTTGRYSIM